MTARAFNFSPGPAILPVEVLETVTENIMSYQGSGIGVMEMSHRSAAFEEIIQTAESNLRQLLNIGEDYAVIFVPGGASTQFSVVPLSFVKSGQTADYIITGIWAEKALAEAKRLGKEVATAATSKDNNFSSIPEQITVSKNSAYVHFTSNNTIVGTQFAHEPEVSGATLICDASSDLLCRNLDVSKYGVIYAGAQKNLGPAGVTIVIVKKDLLTRIPSDLPVMFDYNTHVKNSSLYNTPPTFPIYVVGEVFKWLKQKGGLTEMEKLNRKKAAVLYDTIETSDFFEGHAEKNSRSLMNVTFRIKNPSLDKEFLEAAKKEGLAELQGHRLVGGFRASIYNAFPIEGVIKLSQFMKEFAAKRS